MQQEMANAPLHLLTLTGFFMKGWIKRRHPLWEWMGKIR
jgi:hypothetical protein